MLVLPSGAAFAQGSPFQSLPPADSSTQTQPTTTNSSGTSSDSGGLSTTEAILVFIAGVAVITAIGLWIARDARRRAPLTAGDVEAAHRMPDAHKRGQAAKSKQRAKARHVREQRRRNR